MRATGGAASKPSSFSNLSSLASGSASILLPKPSSKLDLIKAATEDEVSAATAAGAAAAAGVHSNGAAAAPELGQTGPNSRGMQQSEQQELKVC